MKQLLTFILLVLTLPLLGQERILPRNLSLEEQAMLAWYDWTAHGNFDRGIAEPPPFPVRHFAEWEELEALVVTWRSYKNILVQIIKHAKEEVKVLVVVAPTGNNNQANAEMFLANNGVSLDNIEFVVANSNSVWSRDYLQNTVYADEVGDRFFIDWVYNRPRPDDDVLSDVIGAHLGIPVHSMTAAPHRLVNTGGNFMSDGLGTAFSSKLILEENQPNNMFNAGPHDETAIDSIHQLYMGIDRYVKMETLPYDVINHIDMHMHLLDEESILFGQYPTGVADGPQIEANIQYLLANHSSVFGTPYRIERILQPPDFGGNYPNANGNYRTYTNSVFVNKTILLPTYEEQYDTIALRIYREHFPGYKVVGINANDMISALGALHCITKEVGAKDPLWIVHQRQRDITDNMNWGDYHLWADIKHRSGIEWAKIHWTADTSAGYSPLDMTLFDAATNTWTASIPHQPNGTEVFYYIEAGANSGKTQVRPLTAPAGYFKFKVNDQLLPAEEKQRVTLAPIFPNPANAITAIPIHLPQCYSATVELLDTSGRLVEVLFEGELPQGVSNVFLDASKYNSGLYFVRVATDQATVMGKVVLQ